MCLTGHKNAPYGHVNKAKNRVFFVMEDFKAVLVLNMCTSGNTDLFSCVSILIDSLHRNNIVLHVSPGSHNPTQDCSHL